MTADYNGWNDAPEAEREALDDYTRRELEGDALATTMRTDRARLRVAPAAPRVAARCPVWRPLPEPVVHVLSLEDGPGNVAARIHSHFAISFIRSSAFVMVESRRGLVAHRNQVLLSPRFQLCAMRAQGEPGPGLLTLLLDASDLEGLAVPDQPAIVTDQACVGRLGALVAPLQRPVGFLGREAIPRSLLEQLFACGAPLQHARSCGRSLAPVRRHLHDHLGELIPTAALAEMSGLTESHFIRAFHLEFGLPPQAYHLRARLARAVELLSSGLSVATVASECGFADQSHLSRKCKEVYGLTPGAWKTAVGVARGESAERRPVPERVLELLPTDADHQRPVRLRKVS